MGYRRFLLPLLGGPNDKASLSAAFALAEGFTAHVDACFVRLDSIDTIPYLGFHDSSTEAAREEFRLHSEKKASQASARARRQFNSACKKWGVSKTFQPGKLKAPTVQWRDVIGRPELEIPQLAKLRDATVFGGPLSDYHLLIPSVLERTLLHSGRPLLFVPDGTITIPPRTAVIAWDASLPATRAVAAALPFLQDVEVVEVLTFEDEFSDTPDPAELVEYLAWHGHLSQGFVLTKPHHSIAQALIAAAKERGAEILIMGGFAHNRFEEIVFGGTTLEVLRHSMLPVLMMH